MTNGKMQGQLLWSSEGRCQAIPPGWANSFARPATALVRWSVNFTLWPPEAIADHRGARVSSFPETTVWKNRCVITC